MRFSSRALSRRRLAAGLAMLAAAAPFGSVAPARGATLGRIAPDLQRLLDAEPRARWPVIVEMGPLPPGLLPHPNLRRAAAALALLRLYGQPVGTLPVIGAAAGIADAAGVAALAAAPGVAVVHCDRSVGPRPGAAAPAGPPPRPVAVYPLVVGADQLWRLGATGRGVAVALLDSGVAPDADLTQPTNRLLASVNFAGSRGALADPGGHGTHVAGI